jgi:hypothetical protein
LFCRAVLPHTVSPHCFAALFCRIFVCRIAYCTVLPHCFAAQFCRTVLLHCFAPHCFAALFCRTVLPHCFSALFCCSQNLLHCCASAFCADLFCAVLALYCFVAFFRRLRRTGMIFETPAPGFLALVTSPKLSVSSRNVVLSVVWALRNAWGVVLAVVFG